MSVSNISHESHHFREVHNLDGWLKVFCLYEKNKICGGCNSTAVFSDKHTHICISVSEMCNIIKVTIAIENDFKSNIEVVADITFDVCFRGVFAKRTPRWAI